MVGENSNAVIFGYFSDGLIAKGIILEMDSNSVINWIHQLSGSNATDAAYNSGLIDNLDNMYVCGSIVNGSKNDLIVQKFSPENSIGFQQQDVLNDFIVYPNPFSSVLNIRSRKPNFDIIIFDSQLKKVYEKIGNQNQSILIDLEDLESGFYFLKMGEYAFKLIRE